MNRSAFFRSMFAGLIGGYGALFRKDHAMDLGGAPASTPNPTQFTGLDEIANAKSRVLEFSVGETIYPGDLVMLGPHFRVYRHKLGQPALGWAQSREARHLYDRIPIRVI